MRRCLLLLLPLALLALTGPVPAEDAPTVASFLTPHEIEQIDTALTLLNMSREDLEFDKLVLDDDWRLPVVNRTLSHPLESADVAWDWATVARETPSVVWARAKKEVLATLPAKGEPLDEKEHDRLRRWAFAALVSGDTDEGLIPKPDAGADPVAMLGLAARVDREKITAVADRLLELIQDPERCRLLAQLAQATGGGSLDFGTGLEVHVAGEGNDVHDLTKNPPAILIDLGGDDRYVAPGRATPDHPVAIVIDLGGDDQYGNGESLSCGAGFFGVGMVADHGGGDDRYRSGHLSQGCGLFGLGVLLDDGGDDVYRCKDTGQGAGAWGVGLLFDRGEGNDTFHADLFGQGFAYVGGLGLLHNEKGQDVYEAGGVHLHYPLFNDRYQSLSQGFSIGMRPHASGGVGLLIDDSGNDRYACDIYGQGASYWFAYGALVDRDGNDTYTLGQYGQGGGIHLAVGCLIDIAGQDLYYNMHGVGTGGAHDFAVGLLIDRAGDDYYAGSGGTMGGALTNSFALLLDAAGDDGYSAVKVRHTEGGGRSARGMGSIGLFLDLGGKDLHGLRTLENSSWTKETYGAGLDLPEPSEPADPRPTGRPPISPEEIDRRIREAAWDDSRGAYDLEKLWTVCRQWAVGDMASVVPVALDRFVALGDPALEKALSRVGSRSGLELRAVKYVLKDFSARSIAPLVALLSDEEASTRASAVSLLADVAMRSEADAKAAASKIAPLLEDAKAKRAALDALARLGAKEHWAAVAKLLEDPVERTRVSAVRCLQKMKAAEAISALAARLWSTEMFTVRFAAEDALVSLGAPATPTLLDLARREGDRTARRHGIRALGRQKALEGLSVLETLTGHSDWRIRFDAAAAVGAFLDQGETVSALVRDLLTRRAQVESNPHVKGRLTRLLD